jgi:hypothetical protein
MTMTTLTTGTGADLLRGAAHLLRTPLGVILGMTATLREHDARFTSEQRSMYLGEVLQAADEMRVALDGMSMLARLVTGTLTFTPETLALDEFSRAGAGSLLTVWGTEEHVSVAPAAGSAHADPQRLGQALEALARTFQPAPGVALSATSGEQPAFRLGPVTPRSAGDELNEMLTAPLAGAASAEWVARPGGWSLILARYLLETQRARLHIEQGEGEVTLVITLPAARS